MCHAPKVWVHLPWVLWHQYQCKDHQEVDPDGQHRNICTVIDFLFGKCVQRPKKSCKQTGCLAIKGILFFCFADKPAGSEEGAGLVQQVQLLCLDSASTGSGGCKRVSTLTWWLQNGS